MSIAWFWCAQDIKFRENQVSYDCTWSEKIATFNAVSLQISHNGPHHNGSGCKVQCKYVLRTWNLITNTILGRRWMFTNRHIITPSEVCIPQFSVGRVCLIGGDIMLSKVFQHFGKLPALCKFDKCRGTNTAWHVKQSWLIAMNFEYGVAPYIHWRRANRPGKFLFANAI